MGCCYSHEDEYDPEPRPVYAWRSTPTTTSSSQSNYYNNYRTVPLHTVRSVPIRNQISTPNVRAVVIKPTQEFKPRPGALYGEYKCSKCKYFWVSRLSWRDKYQQCKRCKANVRPRYQRELLLSDFTRGENDVGLEHPQDLCEMCKQVGGYCGKYK